MLAVRNDDRGDERGQVLPLWIFSTLMLLAFVFFAADYAYTLSWQIRAQNAADSMAQAMLVEQSQEFNQMEFVLYASAIEETRARHLITGMRLAARRSGDCTYTTTFDGKCQDVYNRLQPAYAASVRRYTDDVILLGQVVQLTMIDHINVAKNAAAYGSLICAISPDCAFNYNLVDYRPRRDATYGPFGVETDAVSIAPGQVGGYQTNGGNRLGGALDANFAPPEVEVITCANVPPFFAGVSSFFGLQTPRFNVIARAAATAAPVMTEWVVPGNGTRGDANDSPLVGADDYDTAGYGGTTATARQRGDGWYDYSYDGSPPGGFAPSSNTFTSPAPVGNTNVVMLNWWRPIPIAPFTGRQNLAAVSCHP